MKERHLPFYCLCNQVKPMASARIFYLATFCMPLLLLVACTRTPKDDGATPPSLYSQPIEIEANPTGGYAVNPVTGRTLQPLTNASGRKVITGTLIPAVGRPINPELVAKPKVVKLVSNPKRVKARTNVFSIPENLKTIALNESRLKKHTAENSGIDIVFTNLAGDTIPTGVSIAVKGKPIASKFPKAIPALQPRMKENALFDIQYLDIEEGISSAFVRCMLEDRSGNLWFGTFAGGISRYDGKSFIHFTDTEGLSNNTVNSILEDKAGNLWFATAGGVSKYDGKSFVQYTIEEGLTNNNVLSILEDRAGNLWFGTGGGGVSRYQPPKDGQEGFFVHFSTAEGLSDNTVNSIIEDSSGNIWLGTDGGGVNRYEPPMDDKLGSFVHYTTAEGLSNNTVKSILEDRSGNLWFGTDGGGLSRFEKPNEGKPGFFIHYTTAEGLSNNIVNSILEDKSGNLWFGTFGEGVSKYEPSKDGKSGSFIHFSTAEGLSNKFVNSILEDKSGNLWFATQGGGVNRYNIKSFVHFTETVGLLDNRVISILEDRSGNLWFGTQGGGISKYESSKKSQAGTFVHFTETEGLSNNNIWAILEDRAGNLWISTLGGGVSKYQPPKDGKDGSLVHFTTAEGLSNNAVRTILEDKAGNFWFGTFGGGVNKYVPSKDGKMGYFVHFTEAEGLSNNYIRAMFEDKAGNIWIGSDGGLSKYEPPKDGQEGTFVHYTTIEGLSDNSIWSILEDKKGNLWLGMGGSGASRFAPPKDGRAGSFVHFTTAAGLSNKFVNAIVEDRNGNIWFATGGGGLSRYEPANNGLEGYFVHFTTTEGLSNNIVRSLLEDKDGNLWFGTQGGGVSRYNVNAYSPSKNPPVIHLRQLNINRAFPDYSNPTDIIVREISFDDIKGFENYPLNLKLPFDKNHLSFHFSAIDWASPQKIRYSFRMLGLQENWSNPTSDGAADYRNMPYGTFTFQIRAIGELGQWSEPFEYTFTIRPPWWLTWWAYMLYILSFLAVLGIFSKWRERNLIREKENLELKVKERTTELEIKSNELTLSLENLKSTQDQLIQQEKLASLGQLTAGIAHEIKNPLNFVNNFSEVSIEMMEEIKEERAKSQETRDETLVDEILEDIQSNLGKIHEHGSRANGIVTSMLQHSRGGTGKKEPTDLNALIKEYVNLCFHGMRAGKNPINVEIALDLDPDVDHISLMKEDFTRVIINICNNAFDAMREKLSKTQDARHKIQDTGLKNTAVRRESGLDINQEENGKYEPRFKVSTRVEGGQVQICFEDNGPGIPDEIKDKILQPFFTTKKGTEGTGLGLSITHDIVKAHGGTIEVQSQSGQTIFLIQLPISGNNNTLIQ